jgi:hypothetical protein
MLIAFSASSIAVKYKKKKGNPTRHNSLKMGNLLFVAPTLLSSISGKLSA